MTREEIQTFIHYIVIVTWENLIYFIRLNHVNDIPQVLIK